MENPLPEDLKRSYDDTIVLIAELTEEATAILQKFGTTSKLYKAKLSQIERIKKHYKISAAFIEQLIAENRELGTRIVADDLLDIQRRYGLKFGQACKVLDVYFSDERIRTIEKIDDLIDKATQMQRIV